jgi:LPS export ABC transporter protein LptC
MKPRKQDLSSLIRHRIQVVGSILIIAGLIILGSCKNDIDYINALSEGQDFPVQIGKNFEVQYTDSGRLQVIFRAPLVERYIKDNDEGSYYEFGEGIEIDFYNKSEVVESRVTARYGKYWEEKNLGFASDSVVARNLISGEQLNTEELYWDRENQKIYSDVFTKITNDEGVFYGEEGFESDENYKLLGSSGTVNIEDEEIP